MNDTSNWTKLRLVIMIAVGGLAAVLLVMGVVGAASSPGPGEVAYVLHGGLTLLAFLCALGLAVIVGWLYLWRLKWLRYAGVATL